MTQKRVNVAIGVLVERTGGGVRVLITRRLSDAVLGGLWELPGGKVEAGETPAQCVVREFLEEVGVEVAVDEPLGVIEHEYDHAHVRLHPFLCTHRGGEVRNLAVADHRWVAPHDLDGYQFSPANAPLMKQVVARLAAVD